MKVGPDIARVAALIGDPARANMLTALMSGKALTATELAVESGITPQTASSHLAKLLEGGLLVRQKQGRHHYFALADEQVGALLESLMGVAAANGHLRTRTGPKDPALRFARICYDHLAGEMGVRMFDSMRAQNILEEGAEGLALTRDGVDVVEGLGIDLRPIKIAKRPMCRRCLDWSARRSHLGGALGKVMLDRFVGFGWLNRQPDSRIVRFTKRGEQEFAALFPV